MKRKLIIKIPCAFCSEPLFLKKWQIQRVKHNFCNNSCSMMWRYCHGLDRWNVAKKANESVRKNGQPKHRGKPAAWILSSNRDAISKKISEAKKKNNWMKGRTGSKHHLWRGGKIWWRGKDWDTVKEEARKRDHYQCVKCGRTDEENIIKTGQPLAVDHIIPYRISKNNNLLNLQTLCHSCHGKKQKVEWLMLKK